MATTMAETPKKRRPRRRFDDDFKTQAFGWCSAKARAPAPSLVISI